MDELKVIQRLISKLKIAEEQLKPNQKDAMYGAIQEEFTQNTYAESQECITSQPLKDFPEGELSSR